MNLSTRATVVAGAALVAGSVLSVGVAAAAAGRDDPASTDIGGGRRAASCAGAWQLSIYEQPGEAPLRGLVSVQGDHTVIYGETSAITSLTRGVPVEYTSPGVGVWSGSGRHCAYRIIVTAADVHGVYTRTSDIRGTLTVSADGKSFAGPLTISVSHANGGDFAFTTRATATRIS